MGFLNKQSKWFFLVIVVFFLFFNLNFVFADFDADSGLTETAVETGHISAEPRIYSLTDAISKIIGIALSLVGIVFLGLIIYGGYMWMTARGNEQAVEKAKNIIINSVIGLVIILAAYGITTLMGTILPK